MPSAGLEGGAVGVEAAGEHVHRRRADEAGDEEVGRRVVELERRADLLDAAVVHDDDLVGHGHRLDLVVGDVDGGGLQPLVQVLDLGAHRDAELGVEVRERLVEQEDLRVADDGAAHGDALALAAGELARVAAEQRREAEDLGGGADAGLDLGLRRALQRQREGHVLGDGQVRVERVVLEHHGDVAGLRRQVVDPGAADQDVARGDVLEAGEHAEQGGLATAGGADEDDELTLVDVDRDPVQDLDGAEGLPQVADGDRRHARAPPPVVVVLRGR